MKGFFEKNKTFLVIIIAVFIIGGFLSLFNTDDVEARSGCCSWHGGVCGCRCCDGTPLSAKCLPYYPHCQAKPTPKYEPPAGEPPAEEQFNEQPLAPQEDLPELEKYTAEIPKEDNGGSFWGWVIGLGGMGYLVYTLKKRKEK